MTAAPSPLGLPRRGPGQSESPPYGVRSNLLSWTRTEYRPPRLPRCDPSCLQSDSDAATSCLWKHRPFRSPLLVRRLGLGLPYRTSRSNHLAELELLARQLKESDELPSGFAGDAIDMGKLQSKIVFSDSRQLARDRGCGYLWSAFRIVD